jgi:GNAT superfamily N-acetyltransferase
MISHPPMSGILIRALAASDDKAFRALRLDALAASPEAFGSSHEEEAAFPLEIFQARIEAPEPSVIFGAFADDALVGMAGFLASEKRKQRHKGTLWGVFVRPAWRGHGIAERLVRRVVEHAGQHVTILQANVVTMNRHARMMYQRLGFNPYGVEWRALCVDGVFYDEELLALDLDRPNE